MKIFKTTFFFLFTLVSVQLIGQITLDEGVIVMEITEVSSDNDQVAAQMQMLNGTQTTYTFNAEKSMVTSDMMGGMLKMKTLVNNADEHLTMLFDAMGQKMLIKSTKEDRAELEETQNEIMEGLEISYDENDTKEILGYDCIKATISGESDSGMEFTMYVATGIQASNRLIQGLSAFELNGFPLEYTLVTDQMSLTTVAQSLETTVPADAFELNTSGYTEMTFDQFTQQMGGMGGMGF